MKKSLLISQLKRPKAFFSGAEKQIKIRMKVVSNIGKITKAMKMVASSKRRQELLRLESGKDFAVHMIPEMFENDSWSKSKVEPFEPKKILMIPVTTDRGLCGGINSGTIRFMREIVNQDRGKYEILCLGDKGAQALTRPYPDIFKTAITEIMTPFNFYNVSCISTYILNNEQKWDELHILYNKYINTISFKPNILKIMNFDQFKKQFMRLSTYEVSEPDNYIALPYFYEIYVASQFYHALLQNAACEQSARMNAMENASKNAGEIFEKLTLKYNKARQGRITMELMEIISGASAL